MALLRLDLAGFEVEAVDGLVGNVERSVTDAAGAYLVVDAGALAPLGGRVLLPAGVVADVDLDLERVSVRLTRDQIGSSPAYDWRIPLEQQERERFATYYGVPARPRLGAVADVPREEKTKRELYEEAKKLEIPGRSTMSKAELARAIDVFVIRRPI